MKKLSASLVQALALATVLAAYSASAGDISGKVTLKGTPPKEREIKFDPTCGAMHQGPATTRWYVVGADKGLADVFVYISKGAEGKKFEALTTPVTLDQNKCMYQPYVIGVMVNQPVEIKNSDPVMHNVHALPRVDGNNEFNFAQPLQGQTDQRKFAKQEVLIKLKCEVHDWMFAYVGVVDNPYFAVTDKDGNFTIKNVPPGNYTLTAYHLKTHNISSKGVTQDVKVEGGPATANFTVEIK
jgi:plastocyanin